ncbi:MAG: heparinase II/III family protein, partial [Nitrospinaceae bacterium]
ACCGQSAFPAMKIHVGDNWRVRFRGTAYHNTVQVDHKNQTRYEQGKRRFKIKGPEPDHELKTFLTRPGFDFIHGVAKSHAYGAVHERRIFFALGEYWIVFDDLTSGETHDYDQRFHLSQHAFQKVKADFRDESIVVSSPHLLLAQPQEEGLNIYLEKGFVSLLYGEKSPAPVLRFSRRAGNAFFPTVLYPYKSHAPKLSLRRIPVFKEDGTPADRNAQAISIHLEVMGTPSNDYCFAAPPGSTEVLNFGDWRYRGSYLFLRTDSTGRVTHLHTNPGAEIQGKGISHALRKETP